MAYLSNPLEDDKKQQAQAGTPSTSGVIDSSTGGVGAPGGAPAANGADQRTPGTGFVNLQSYLNANQGEGARMANDINKPLASEADAYKGNAQSAVADQTKALQSQTGADKVGTLKSGVLSNPTATLQSARDFLGSGNVDTSGATNAKAGLQASQKSLDDRLSKVTDPGTQITNLNQAYGKSGSPYTQGFSTLDQFLVNGSEDGRGALKAIQDKATGVDAAYNDASGQLDSAATTAQQQLDANRGIVKSAAQQARDARLTAARGRMLDMNAKLDPNGRDGVVNGSLGDALQGSDLSDLEALSALTGQGNGDDWYKHTYNAGTTRPVLQTDQGEVSAAGVSGSKNGINGVVPGLKTTAADELYKATHPDQNPLVTKPLTTLPSVNTGVANTLNTITTNTGNAVGVNTAPVTDATTQVANAVNQVIPTVPAIKKPKIKWH